MAHQQFINEEDRLAAETVMNKFKTEKTEEDIFYHFCFTILVPQATHKNTMVVVENLKKKNFFGVAIPEDTLKELVKSTRFFNNKTKYLLILKQNWEWIYEMTISLRESLVLRDFLVESVQGLGMKAASHLMRNLGHDDVAIIDTHILKHYGFKAPKNNKEYIGLEAFIREDAKQYGLSVGLLDIYLWKSYSNTNWKDFIY